MEPPASRPQAGPRRVVRRLRRAVRARRRLLSAALVFVAVLAAVSAARPPAPPSAPVLVAARDLPSGTELRDGDVDVRRVDPGSVPRHAYTDPGDVTGRAVAAPVRAGAPLTDWSLLQDDALAGHPPGSVLATVRVADPSALAGLRVGDRVHVVAADPSGEQPARVLARRADVAALPQDDGAAAWEGDGGLVVLAVPEDVALAFAGSAGRDRLDLVVAGRGDGGVVE